MLLLQMKSINGLFQHQVHVTEKNQNRGNVGGNFTASIYNQFKSFGKHAQSIAFGATATPNLEQIGKMECAAVVWIILM